MTFVLIAFCTLYFVFYNLLLLFILLYSNVACTSNIMLFKTSYLSTYLLNYKTKLETVSLSCRHHRSKTANIKILYENSKHRR